MNHQRIHKQCQAILPGDTVENSTYYLNSNKKLTINLINDGYHVFFLVNPTADNQKWVPWVIFQILCNNFLFILFISIKILGLYLVIISII